MVLLRLETFRYFEGTRSKYGKKINTYAESKTIAVNGFK